MKSYRRDDLTRITITIPSALLDEVDRLVSVRGRSRYIAHAAWRQVERDRIGRALRATEGAAPGDEGWSKVERLD
jgi:metal-responsive CopG/Arc/MetJ family transcriptional regulator